MLEAVRRRVIAFQPPKSPNPENPPRIPFNGRDRIIAEAGPFARLVAVLRERSGGRIIAIQPAAPGPDPQITILLFRSKDAVMADRAGIIRVMFIDLEGISIIAVETILGANPEISFAVLKDDPACVLRKSVFDGDVFEPNNAPGGALGLNRKSGFHLSRRGAPGERKNEQNDCCGDGN